MPVAHEVLQRPFWDGVPEDLGSWWTLRKRDHVATCRMYSHQLGWELRLDVDRDIARTAVCRIQSEMFDTEMEWRLALEGKGWTATPPEAP